MKDKQNKERMRMTNQESNSECMSLRATPLKLDRKLLTISTQMRTQCIRFECFINISGIIKCRAGEQ